jgi:hypothetical protein
MNNQASAAQLAEALPPRPYKDRYQNSVQLFWRDWLICRVDDWPAAAC